MFRAMAAELRDFYRQVRSASEALAKPLSPEDQTPQSMPDASPVKWHLAHTTWFFETFVLEKALPGHAPCDPAYRVLFNSYYNSVGEQFARPQRGLVTRPGIGEVRDYRQRVDSHMEKLLTRGALSDELARVALLGLHHEQQHQELIVTDLKHLLAQNPTHPTYGACNAAGGGAASGEIGEDNGSAGRNHGGGARIRGGAADGNGSAASGDGAPPLAWRRVSAGLREFGHGGAGFAFDNEGPRHLAHLHGFELASRPVTAGEYLEFMADSGYQRPELWLSDGWAAVQQHGWRAPLYWQQDGAWFHYTLAGLAPVHPAEPVTHVSAYEADAYARWAGARLPTELEWEAVAADTPLRGHFAEHRRFHPAPASAAECEMLQLYGDVWEWTASAYAPYPGYTAPPGALGEYNGKFMANQLVLRGGSCATPARHIRATYRNFFYPDARWQYSGIRLARNAE